MPESISDWVIIIGAIGLFVFGGGGVIAWFRLRDDSRKGVRQENRSDSDALNAQAVALVETQFNYLVKPLQIELQAVRDEVARLNTEVRAHRAMYDLAVTHIRTLYNWIKKHMTAEMELSPPPAPPVELLGDLH